MIASLLSQLAEEANMVQLGLKMFCRFIILCLRSMFLEKLSHTESYNSL